MDDLEVQRFLREEARIDRFVREQGWFSTLETCDTCKRVYVHKEDCPEVRDV
jgi:hypothetical protein